MTTQLPRRLGGARAIYAAEVKRGAGKLELARIERAGRLLADAIDLAATSSLGTMGHYAAWKNGGGGGRASRALWWTP